MQLDFQIECILSPFPSPKCIVFIFSNYSFQTSASHSPWKDFLGALIQSLSTRDATKICTSANPIGDCVWPYVCCVAAPSLQISSNATLFLCLLPGCSTEQEPPNTPAKLGNNPRDSLIVYILELSTWIHFSVMDPSSASVSFCMIAGLLLLFFNFCCYFYIPPFFPGAEGGTHGSLPLPFYHHNNTVR